MKKNVQSAGRSILQLGRQFAHAFNAGSAGINQNEIKNLL